jgi:hypothetical protein
MLTSKPQFDGHAASEAARESTIAGETVRHHFKCCISKGGAGGFACQFSLADSSQSQTAGWPEMTHLYAFMLT